MRTELQHSARHWQPCPWGLHTAFLCWAGPCPCPQGSLTCHSVGNAGDCHRLCLCLDPRVRALHLHHQSFNLQNGMGWISGEGRREPCEPALQRGEHWCATAMHAALSQPFLGARDATSSPWQLTLPLDTHTQPGLAQEGQHGTTPGELRKQKNKISAAHKGSSLAHWARKKNGEGIKSVRRCTRCLRGSDHSCTSLHSPTQVSAPTQVLASKAQPLQGWGRDILLSGSISCLGFLRDPGDSFLAEDESHTQGQTTFISHSQLSLFLFKR